MFQSHVFFKDYSNNRSSGERGRKTISDIALNLALLAEKEGVTATFLGSPARGCKSLSLHQRIIHRVPSKEEATATFLGNHNLSLKYIKINRKNAPKSISLCHNYKTRRKPMERCSYSTYVIGKGKEYSFEFKQDAVFAAQELGIKPAARRFKVSRNTLRAWNRRFEKNGKRGLIDRRKGPYHIPNKMPKEMEERIVSIRKRAPCFGPMSIKYHYNIPYSLGAIQRVIRSNGLTRKRRKFAKKEGI